MIDSWHLALAIALHSCTPTLNKLFIIIILLFQVLNGKSSSQESFLAVIWTYSQYNNDIKAGIKGWSL